MRASHCISVFTLAGKYEMSIEKRQHTLTFFELPPQVRGIATDCRGVSLAVWFTPAHAGNTIPADDDFAYREVHPRTCGEY